MIDDPTRLYPPSEEEAATAEAMADSPSPVKQVQALTVEQAIQSMKLLKARTDAETAEYQKRLVMQQFRPCKIYPVIIYHDGLRWVCSYGVLSDQYKDYLPSNSLGQSGVEAYGEFPEEAMKNFDGMWIGSSLEEADDEDEDEDEGDDCDE